VAYKRRYLKNGTEWHYQFEVDGTARQLIDLYDADPAKIESAIDLAADPERRIKMQADVQDYVDQAISSTLNLPSWGTELNNEDTVGKFADLFARYAPRLRGLTCYPDGARGGQPLTPVPYEDAVKKQGEEFIETYTDVCSLTGGGTCGI
jgi:ribonucleoside-diphosphate reductase alpha chain